MAWDKKTSSRLYDWGNVTPYTNTNLTAGYTSPENNDVYASGTNITINLSIDLGGSSTAPNESWTKT